MVAYFIAVLYLSVVFAFSIVVSFLTAWACFDVKSINFSNFSLSDVEERLPPLKLEMVEAVVEAVEARLIGGPLISCPLALTYSSVDGIVTKKIRQ
jgi:hypothetical protein